MKERYDHKAIEPAAQKKWEELELYTADLADDTKDPYYLLFEFPYPSGDLHIGHWYAFALTDIYARYLRMKGKNVLFPIGFDAFGLPAENAAIKHGADPKEWTYQNMERMRAQLKTMGTSVDWSKEVVSSDPSYYHWTQWIFTKFFEHGLAERREASVKWCPNDQTVLANEQVTDGKCERCGHEVEEKSLTQWFLGITKYADRLLADLDKLDWPSEIKDAQRAWIGESEGTRLSFELSFTEHGEHNAWRDPDGKPAHIEVFTTRPDTLYGATYLVLAPEHPWVRAVWDTEHDDVASNKKEIAAYVAAAARKTERERQENKEKTGVRIEGVVAINPVTKEEMPVYVADYVLASYGTGAVMAVPAHDERDFAFAQKYGLPAKNVIEPLFVRTHGTDAVRPEEPMVERNAVVCIVRHWSEDKYLCLRWKSNDWTGFVIGGIEEGEDPAVTGAREIAEETGYRSARFVRSLEAPTHSQFYHEVKRQNRFAHFMPLYYELANGDREEPSAEELAIHDVEWVSREGMDAYLSRDNDIAHIWKVFAHPPFAYTGDGVLANSGPYTGRGNREALWEITAAAAGERVKNFRIRDWSVGRQRYWGCPIPIVYDPSGKAHAIPAEHLPWLLPTDVDFRPQGKSPLASSRELHERVERIFGEGWTPEYDTLDTFVDSSWYFFRYLDPKNEHEFTSQALAKKWMPIDRYSGGAEHTTLHLLYSRFVTKVLYDLALSPVDEPYAERFNRGLILGPDGAKMSKSKGNVINPDEFVQKYGADAVRMYLAFIGPYNEPGNYACNLDGLDSMRRFLDRVYALKGKVEDVAVPGALAQALAQAAAKVATDTERFKLNTAVAALMVALKELEGATPLPSEAYQEFLRILAPYAPHLAEHLYAGEGSVHASAWPEREIAVTSEATVVVQVNGKKRGEITLAKDAGEEEAVTMARGLEAVAKAINSAPIVKTVYIQGRILNLVTGGP